jgi:hypothetical protein
LLGRILVIVNLASPPLIGHSLLAASGALPFVTLLGCSGNRGVSEVTTVVFDGQSHTVNGSVTCITQLDSGKLVILVDGGSQNTVRVLLRRENRLVVEKVGVHIGNVSGYSGDSGNVWATKVDDRYEINGRMPPNTGENTWHDFKIEVRCRSEVSPTYTPGRPPRLPRN